jgi:hypothetical protein
MSGLTISPNLEAASFRIREEPKMNSVSDAGGHDLWLGEPDVGRSGLWLSPLLIGLSAPAVAGMVLFPELLRDAVSMVAALLCVVLLIALGAYVFSVLAPGAPVALEARQETGVVAIIIRGVVAQREVLVPFKEITKLGAVKAYDHDGYELLHAELKTRDGDTWVIPGEVDEAKLARLRSVIGIRVRTR